MKTIKRSYKAFANSIEVFHLLADGRQGGRFEPQRAIQHRAARRVVELVEGIDEAMSLHSRDEWGEIFDDHTVAAAILDRLLHHATVLQIDGDSYRMRSHRARLTTLRAGLNHPAEGGEFSRSQLGNSHDR